MLVATGVVVTETGSREGHDREGSVGDPHNDVAPEELPVIIVSNETKYIVTYKFLSEQLTFPWCPSSSSLR